MHHVYILSCADGSFYTGWTTDLNQRLRTHNAGKGSKYTRSKLPVSLVYYETFEDKGAALKREHAIKRLSHVEKSDLIKT
ncbi:MAG: GIY-YIG nuclease family protein [Eubacteriales bacterium]|nr:GIY-YIG nuclease family protein [Eubacteriales bacterium]MDD3349460.1 GIY-YIG nuclease family protein [Eubacteriales bacterium]